MTNPAGPYGMPDGNGRVLVAQFNAAAGEHIQGFANIVWENVGRAGGGFVTGVFLTSIPAPGTLALLALAGLAGVRRRRS
ncbi:MAG: PEP-CTERM sorting domain-containing protein [Planctomycetota bacterium]|nr:PEP-CTERM sorting domain-containing protein [Planctomycetota bacterium]